LQIARIDIVKSIGVCAVRRATTGVVWVVVVAFLVNVSEGNCCFKVSDHFGFPSFVLSCAFFNASFSALSFVFSNVSFDTYPRAAPICSVAIADFASDAARLSIA
jgi:hypothetical protein